LSADESRNISTAESPNVGGYANQHWFFGSGDNLTQDTNFIFMADISDNIAICVFTFIHSRTHYNFFNTTDVKELMNKRIPLANPIIAEQST
jgi:hypothetical protein